MPVEVRMPQLSDTMSEGTLVKWHKREGDKVRQGEEVADVETDKATMPMEAPDAGTLAVLLAKEGQKLAVGGVIAVIAVGSEKPADVKQKYASAAPASAAAAAAASAPRNGDADADDDAPGGAPGAHSHDVLHHGPLATGHAMAREGSVQDTPEHTSEAIVAEAMATIGAKRPGAAAAAATGSAGGANGGGGRIRVSPLAKRIAKDRGIELATLAGSGPGGRIILRDVEAYQPAVAAKPADAPKSAPAELPPPLVTGQTRVIEMDKMRLAIAAALQKSKQTIPHFYETIDVDAEAVSDLRARVNDQLKKQNVKLSLADFIHKAIAAALVRHAVVNSTFDGQRVTQHGDVNLGIAVALNGGLIVPVLRGVDRMGLKEIRQRSEDLIARARGQRLKREELSGGTFTVSSLGTFGIREFSAIINPPQVAILAVGAAAKRAVVCPASGQVVARTTMTVTLSADHRVIDGATAAEFLQTLKGLLEEPALMLV